MDLLFDRWIRTLEDQVKSRLTPHSPQTPQAAFAGVAVKSGLYPDEIVRFARDEIKSVLFIPHVSADFIAQRFHPRLRGFIPSVRTDLVENPMLSHRVFR